MQTPLGKTIAAIAVVMAVQGVQTVHTFAADDLPGIEGGLACAFHARKTPPPASLSSH